MHSSLMDDVVVAKFSFLKIPAHVCDTGSDTLIINVMDKTITQDIAKLYRY